MGEPPGLGSVMKNRKPKQIGRGENDAFDWLGYARGYMSHTIRRPQPSRIKNRVAPCLVSRRRNVCWTGYLDGEITCTARPVSPPVNLFALKTVPTNPRDPKNDRNSIGDQRSHRKHEDGIHRYAPKPTTLTLNKGRGERHSHDTRSAGRNILSYNRVARQPTRA